MITTHCGDCLDIMRSMPDKSVQLTFTSPPYPGKLERYGGTGVKLNDREWVAWMLPRVVEMARVTDGPVGIVANNRVHKGCYQPAVESLIVRLWDAGYTLERPTIWHKNAPPNRKDWFGNDYEPIVWVGKAKVWNWEAIGTPPKFTNGGRFRQRTSTGERRLGSEYPQGKVTRPRDVLRVLVGGGHIGNAIACEGEAPYPEALVEPFVLALTNIGDTVFDPFMGTGTTLAVADRHGRNGIGIDIRESQVQLTRRRVAGGAS